MRNVQRLSRKRVDFINRNSKHLMELKYIFYITVNIVNGKFYFGVHRTNPDVFDGYIGNGIYREQQATLDVAFHRAVRKYGYNNFKRTTIAIFPDTKEGREAAYNLETTVVNTTLLRSKQCYNITIGGSGGGNEVQKKTIYQFDLNGNYLRSYKSAREAALQVAPNNVEVIRHSIRNCCLGTSYSSCGYYWSYYKEFIPKENTSKDIKRRKNKIAQYTLSGKYLRYFDNITQARNETGLTNIYYAIKNKASVGNYQWRYYNGDDSDIKPFESIVTVYRTKPIIMISSNNEEVEFESIKKCIETHPEFSSKGIKNVIRGINKTHKGYKFRWKDEDIV